MANPYVRHLWFGGTTALLACAALFVLIPLRALPLRAEDEAVAAEGPAKASPARPSQVTLCGIRATPGEATVDAKLRRKHLDNQLRKMFPRHGFKLLAVDSRPLVAGQTMTCELEDGYVARVELLDPFDKDGKVRLRVRLVRRDATALDAVVTVPPNQLFFCDKTLPDTTRLILGIAAR